MFCSSHQSSAERFRSVTFQKLRPARKLSFTKRTRRSHFALRKGVAGLTELSLETHSPHELLIVLLPKGIPVLVPPDNHAFHVVRKDILRDAHVPEPVEHTNEQVFLLGVGEELHIPLTAVVADHSKAGNRVFFSGERLDLGKAPVHLERVSGAGGVPPPTVSLQEQPHSEQAK